MRDQVTSPTNGDLLAAANRSFSTWEYCHFIGSLLSLGISSPHLAEAVRGHVDRAAEVLASRQHERGYFPSAEFRFPTTEVTALALISLAQAGYERDRQIELGLEFLSGQVRPLDGSVRSTSDGEDVGWPRGPEPARTIAAMLPTGEGLKRTYPAALTLLALSLWDTLPRTRERIAGFLLQQARVGRWGHIREAPPSPGFTAAALTALIASTRNASQFRKSFRYLRSTRLHDNRWLREEEMWLVTSHDRELYASITIPTTTWCRTAFELMRNPGKAREALTANGPDPDFAAGMEPQNLIFPPRSRGSRI